MKDIDIELEKLKNERKKVAYYVIPCIFFKDEKYVDLTFGAKMLYAILRDRVNLSKKNRKMDLIEKNYYCYFSNDNLAKILNVTKRTIINWKNSLLEKNLIYYTEKGRGYRKSNKIFLVKETLEKIENSLEKDNYYRISKRVFLEESFKDLTFREKIFFEILDNKKSCTWDGTTFLKNIDLVSEIKLSEPTIIKYYQKLIDLQLISKDRMIKKSLLKNVKQIYTNSINNFTKKVNGLSQKCDKKTKKVSEILLNFLREKLQKLENEKIQKNFMNFVEKLLSLNTFDIKNIFCKLGKIKFSKIQNASSYILKVIDNLIENKNVTGEDYTEDNKLILDENSRDLILSLEDELDRKLNFSEIRKIFYSGIKLTRDVIELFKIATVYAKFVENCKIEYIIGIVRNWTLKNIKKKEDLKLIDFKNTKKQFSLYKFLKHIKFEF